MRDSVRVEVHPPALFRSGFTTIELIVSIAIIGVLVSIALPVIGRARMPEQRTRCVNNLRNVAYGLTQYDHLHSRLPASVYYFDPSDQPSQPHHSWAVSIRSFADPHPMRSAFYIGSPCLYGDCNAGGVDYARSNQGTGQINSGLDSPEVSLLAPNSFHVGGVNMAFADAHVQFPSELIDGTVYAALASSQGLLLNGTPLEQTIVSGDSF